MIHERPHWGHFAAYAVNGHIIPSRLFSISEFFSRFETDPRACLPVTSLLVYFCAPPFEIVHEAWIDEAKEHHNQGERET